MLQKQQWMQLMSWLKATRQILRLHQIQVSESTSEESVHSKVSNLFLVPVSTMEYLCLKQLQDFFFF